jgi:hypothetical protein
VLTWGLLLLMLLLVLMTNTALVLLAQFSRLLLVLLMNLAAKVICLAQKEVRKQAEGLRVLQRLALQAAGAGGHVKLLRTLLLLLLILQ